MIIDAPKSVLNSANNIDSHFDRKFKVKNRSAEEYVALVYP